MKKANYCPSIVLQKRYYLNENRWRGEDDNHVTRAQFKWLSMKEINLFIWVFYKNKTKLPRKRGGRDPLTPKLALVIKRSILTILRKIRSLQTVYKILGQLMLILFNTIPITFPSFFSQQCIIAYFHSSDMMLRLATGTALARMGTRS